MKSLLLFALSLTLVCSALGIALSSAPSRTARSSEKRHKDHSEDRPSSGIERESSENPTKWQQRVCVLPKRKGMPSCSSHDAPANSKEGFPLPANTVPRLDNLPSLELFSGVPSVPDYDDSPRGEQLKKKLTAAQLSKLIDRVKRAYPSHSPLRMYVTRDSPITAILEAQHCVPDGIGVPLCPDYMSHPRFIKYPLSPAEQSVESIHRSAHSSVNPYPTKTGHPVISLRFPNPDTHRKRPEHGENETRLLDDSLLPSIKEMTASDGKSVSSTEQPDDRLDESDASGRKSFSAVTASEKRLNRFDNFTRTISHDSVIPLKSEVDDNQAFSEPTEHQLAGFAEEERRENSKTKDAADEEKRKAHVPRIIDVNAKREFQSEE